MQLPEKIPKIITYRYTEQGKNEQNEQAFKQNLCWNSALQIFQPPPPLASWIKKSLILRLAEKFYTMLKVAWNSFQHFLLNLWKFKVALNPLHRFFLNFAKSCILSCLS